MSDIPARLRRFVVQRASGRCEHCGLSQEGQEATFHVDHVIPRVEGGPTTEDNLALACVSCSLRKGARRTAIDTQTNQETSLYNPRREKWQEHFAWNGVFVEGLTATGRATISALRMNRRVILLIRQQEVRAGRHPPPEHSAGRQ
jgi:hypothetical protein